MIEYALLYGLGFLSSAMLAMLVAPAIHSRIVRFTENRLKATMPLSPQEIRAQRDMARASYAAENAKTVQALEKERQKTMDLQLKQDVLSKEASRLLAENQDFTVQIEAMNVEAADMRSQLRRADLHISQLKETLQRAEEIAATKDVELEKLMKRLDKVGLEVDNLKIESSRRETEIENLKMRLQTLRDEREDLRREQAAALKRAREAEQRLTQEEHQKLRLDDKLMREMAGKADKDAIIDRRTAEIARLKEQLKSANAELRRRGGSTKRSGSSETHDDDIDMSEPPEASTEELADEIRHQYTALTERLNRAKSAANDDALREEMSEIAAKMILLTAPRGRFGIADPQTAVERRAESKGRKADIGRQGRRKNCRLGRPSRLKRETYPIRPCAMAAP